MAGFLKWLLSSKPAGEYGKEEDPEGLKKTMGRGKAKEEAIRELEKEFSPEGDKTGARR